MNDEERRAELKRLQDRQRASIKANLATGMKFEILEAPEPTFEQRWGPLAPLIRWLRGY